MRRKITKSATKRIYGFHSIKSDNYFRVESGNEFGACYHLEFRDSIISFEAQPQGYNYIEFRRNGFYTSDFDLEHHDTGKELLEIKSDEESESQVFKEVFKCQKEGAVAQGLSLALMTESEIKKEPLLRNLKLLYKYRTEGPLTIKHFKILDCIENVVEISIESLCAYLCLEKKEGYPLIYDLVARGELKPVQGLAMHALSSQSVLRKRL
ncbi:TnsA endonuclease N-terminal domain-containing protein [Spongorhabdus nitratireducens]